MPSSSLLVVRPGVLLYVFALLGLLHCVPSFNDIPCQADANCPEDRPYCSNAGVCSKTAPPSLLPSDGGSDRDGGNSGTGGGLDGPLGGGIATGGGAGNAIGGGGPGNDGDGDGGLADGGGNADGGLADGGFADGGNPVVTCSSASYQPDVCGYGGVCGVGGTCQDAVNDTCDNITAAISKGNYSAWTANSTGPVIYSIQDEADDATKCVTGATPFTLTVYAYAGSTVFPDSKLSLPGFWLFDASGNKTDIAGGLLQAANYEVENSGKNMRAKFTVCAAAGLTELTVGFAFTGGNASCATLVHWTVGLPSGR